MIRTSSRSFPLARLAERRGLVLVLGLGLAMVAALLAGAAALFATLGQAPPGVALSLGANAADVPLGSTIRVAPEGWDARLEGAALFETPTEGEGRTGPGREIPLQLEIVRAGWLPGQTELLVRPAEGTLRPDAAYRLVVRGSALVADFPWPRTEPVEREIRFTTPASPRPLPRAEATPLKWEEPLEIRWNLPIEELGYRVTPPAASRSEIDPTDRRLARVTILEPEEETTYEITVTEARGSNGITLQRPASYRAVTPARPRVLDAPESMEVEIGEPVRLAWNVPVERVEYRLDPPVESSLEPDPKDPTVRELRLEGLAQGSRYELTVLEAWSDSGAPLAEPQTIALVTPRKLMVDDLDVGVDPGRVPVRARPTLIFADPIRDRGAAEAAITIEPAVPGRFEWLDDSQVRFIPTTGFPYDSQITFRIRPGPDGPRSVAGAYFERPAVLSFKTELDKIIDVNVSRQVMTLIQAGRAVQTFPVQTGVPGADTPLGEFAVQYKMPVARFRGVNVTGSSYDIPDVKWVMSFLGDYTIHGVYWRSGFGRPGSNGCVGLTDANAKLVYDWAPEGTLVRIHF